MLVVEVTEHAIKRYGERVRPSLAAGQLEAEVMHVIEQAGVICWHSLDWCEASGPETVGWVNVGEDVTFPLQFHRSKEGVLVAATCLTRGTLPEATRQARNHRAHVRRARRAAKRGQDYIRGARQRARAEAV